MKKLQKLTPLSSLTNTELQHIVGGSATLVETGICTQNGPLTDYRDTSTGMEDDCDYYYPPCDTIQTTLEE